MRKIKLEEIQQWIDLPTLPPIVLTQKFLVLGEIYSFYVSVEIISINGPALPCEMKIIYFTELLRFGKKVILGPLKNVAWLCWIIILYFFSQ